VYPIILDISHDNDLSRQIIYIKEILHQIPHKGIGYGILKYLTDNVHKKDIDFRLRPQVCFNYLGQLDADVNKMAVFKISDENTGQNQCPQAQRDYLLDILASIERGQLVMTIIYNTRHFHRSSITGLLESFKEKLLKVISHCMHHKERELTPSDLTYKGLTMEDLDTIFDE
jgi:non-ribosomal peptide synthase protein (TIGR01720 family)